MFTPICRPSLSFPPLPFSYLRPLEQASIFDRDSITASASLCHELFGELVQFDLRNGSLRKKFDGVKYDVRKMDDILYELSLVGGNRGDGGSPGGKEGGDAAGRRKRDRDEREAIDGTEIPSAASEGVVDKQEFKAIREAMVAFDEKRCGRSSRRDWLVGCRM